jgi:Fe-S cluster biogenesis protein NfuA
MGACGHKCAVSQLTPAHGVKNRLSADHAQEQATEQTFKDPQDVARDILSVLAADDVRSHLSQIKPFLV